MGEAMKTKKIQFSLDVPVNSDALNLNQVYFQEMLTAVLYHTGKLTLKQAREMLGKSRREFEEDVLPKFGYTTMRSNPENAAIEIAASKR